MDDDNINMKMPAKKDDEEGKLSKNGSTGDGDSGRVETTEKQSLETAASPAAATATATSVEWYTFVVVKTRAVTIYSCIQFQTVI